MCKLYSQLCPPDLPHDIRWTQCRPLAPKPSNIFMHILHILRSIPSENGKYILVSFLHLDRVVAEEVRLKRTYSGQALHVRAASPRNLLGRKWIVFLFLFFFSQFTFKILTSLPDSHSPPKELIKVG